MTRTQTIPLQSRSDLFILQCESEIQQREASTRFLLQEQIFSFALKNESSDSEEKRSDFFFKQNINPWSTEAEWRCLWSVKSPAVCLMYYFCD